MNKKENLALAKETYKIPYTIDNIRLRALVSLKVGTVGLKKQVFIYQVIGWMAVTVLMAVILFFSPVKFAPLWGVPIAFALFGLGLIAFKTQGNGLPGYRWIKPTFNYMVSKSDRHFEPVTGKNSGVKRVKNSRGKVSVTFSPELQKLRDITDLDAISGDSMISFQNGDVGVMFRVSGFTSLVILDQEMDQVIDTIAKWNNSLDTTTSWILITDHSNQRVINQQTALKKLRDEWKAVGEIPAPIEALIMARYKELKAVHQRYKSSQQYLLLRSSSMEVLDKELQQFTASTRQGMLKSAELLSSDDATKVMRTVLHGGN